MKLTRQQELEKVKALLQKHIEDADAGIYDTPNWCGDKMTILYKTKNFTLKICYNYPYYEVFDNINEEFKEFEELETYYNKLVEDFRKKRLVKSLFL